MTLPNPNFFPQLQEFWKEVGVFPSYTLQYSIIGKFTFEQIKLQVFAIPIAEYLRSWSFAQFKQLYDDGYIQVFLWEDVWFRHNTAVKGRLKALLGKSLRVYARQTVIQKIEQPLLLGFLQEHHTNVPIPAKFKYGLFYRGELVAVAGFSSMITLTKEGGGKSSELLRFCSTSGVTVVGGLSKLLKAFIREKKPQHLMTYIDREWSTGRGFSCLGFELVDEKPPQQFWLDPKSLERHYPHRLKGNIPKEWLPAYNRGSLKYIKWV